MIRTKAETFSLGLIFDQDNLEIAITEGYAFCKEVWLQKSGFHKMQYLEHVKCAVSVFGSDTKILDFYSDVCRLAVQNQTK